MKIAVIGAGVVGISTAYALAIQGHQVSVYDKRGAAAEDASFSNTGIAAASLASPWVHPKFLSQTLRQLNHRHTALRMAAPKWRDIQWLLRSKKISAPNNFTRNHERLLRLAHYSSAKRYDWIEALHMDYEQTQGVMLLLRGEREVENVRTSLAVLRDAGVEFQTLTADQARIIEPALRPDTTLTQALYFSQDDVGNSRQFSLLLKQEAEQLGVDFHFNATIHPLSRATPTVLSTIQGTQKFDAVVVCAGTYADDLVKPLGIKLPSVSLMGYTLNAAVRELIDAPRCGIIDQRYKVSISRLGQRVRLSGGNELGHHPHHLAASLKTLYQVLEDWFPRAARTQDNVQVWKGSYPTLQDGLPIIGASGTPGVWLNIGHANHGWTLACGTARLLADTISGRKAEIDIQGLGLERLQTGR